MAEHAAGTSDGALAVVASASAEDRAGLRDMLVAAGYSARTVATTDELLDEVLVSRPDVLLVDLGLALSYSGSLADVVEEHPHLATLPALLILPEGGIGALPAALTPFAADFIFRPVTPAELLHRTHSAISRRRRIQTQRASSARLREAMRRISARIRATNDPAVMVDQFLPAVGQALGAHHVVLQVFDDQRIAALSRSWTDGSLAARAELAVPQQGDLDADLGFATTLWEDSTSAGFHLGPGAVPSSGDVPVPHWLRQGLGEDQDVSGAVAALGEGDRPFGLLWVISAGSALRWTGVESALTQHVLGNLAHGLIQAQLISRQQQAVRKLQSLNQAKTDFVGSVNHELRTPLASIAGYLEMILDGVGGEVPPQAATMLQAVERNTAKLSRLIEDISALSARQVDSSEHGPVDVVHLVSVLTGHLVLEASGGGITLECSLPEHSVTVSGDREELSAAIAIVLSNALKFTPTDGTVSVGLTVDHAEDSMVLAVRDTGIGIPEADLPRLFDSFHRASNAQQVLPGAGVGLSVAKRTFEAHHGSIRIESELGVGTTAIIVLPLLTDAAVG
ncbi:hypothetical protein GM708_09465 [Vibrio cholerae]|nr:hypothetical protein [Vibrio cholerae]